MALQRKEDTSACFQEASTYLTKASQVTIINTTVIDLLTLYPETLPDLMKPSKGTKRRPGTDEHLLAAMQKTSAGLRELREAVRLHPQLAGSSDVQGNLALVPYHAVSEWSKHGSPHHGPSNIEAPKSKIRFRADIASLDTVLQTNYTEPCDLQPVECTQAPLPAADAEHDDSAIAEDNDYNSPTKKRTELSYNIHRASFFSYLTY